MPSRTGSTGASASAQGSGGAAEAAGVSGSAPSSAAHAAELPSPAAASREQGDADSAEAVEALPAAAALRGAAAAPHGSAEWLGPEEAVGRGTGGDGGREEPEQAATPGISKAVLRKKRWREARKRRWLAENAAGGEAAAALSAAGGDAARGVREAEAEPQPCARAGHRRQGGSAHAPLHPLLEQLRRAMAAGARAPDAEERRRAELQRWILTQLLAGAARRSRCPGCSREPRRGPQALPRQRAVRLRVQLAHALQARSRCQVERARRQRRP